MHRIYTFIVSEVSSYWFQFLVLFALVAVGVIFNLLMENRRRNNLNRELVEADRSLNAAIEVASLVFFEYYPEKHYAIGLSKYDPLLDEKELYHYPDSWFARGLTHPEDMDEAKRLFEKIDGGAEYAEADIRNLYAGTYHWFHYRMRSVYDSDGKRIKVIGTRVDITPSKQVEEGYQQQLNAFLTANPNVLVSCRLNLTKNKMVMFYAMQRENRMASEEFATIDDFFRMQAENITFEEERRKYLEMFSVRNLMEQCRNGKSSVMLSYRCTIEQELHWINALVEMVVEPRYGEIDAVYQAVDVTCNQIQELMLETSAQHDYDSLAFIYGRSRRFTRYSWLYTKEMAFQERYNESLLQELGQYPMDDAEEIRKSLQWDNIIENLEARGEYTIYITQYHGDGAKRRKRIHFTYIDKEEQLILGSQRDITDVYENEAKQQEVLTRALQEAKAANKAKTDFLSRMSHDMRTPMNAILGITALALDEIDNPELTAQNLNKISSASHFLLNLINDILDMTKIEDGAVELHLEPYRYDDFIGNLRAMFEPLCKENGLSLVFENQEKNPTVLVDKVRINQVFFNLLSNAVKFTPEGGSIVYREENVEIRENRLYGDYSIIDTGIGMSEEFQERLFQPFVQEDNELTSSIQGTGLGLSITKSLVELMGGSIEIESRLGEGTKVTVHLCSELAQPEKEQPEEEAPRNFQKETLEGKRVLLVEDHPLNAEIAKRLLQKEGIQVTCAENGKAALERFMVSEIGFFDAVLMDIRMPVMDGLTAAGKIRVLERPDARTVPIIAMTANAYAEDVQKTKEAGMNAHLAKPIEPERLYETLAERMR